MRRLAAIASRNCRFERISAASARIITLRLRQLLFAYMALCNRRRARLPRIQRSLRMQFPIRAKPRDVYFDAAIATAGSYFFERE